MNALYQGFGSQDLYPSIETKAANLLYLVVKDHPFLDGNKRSAAALFVYFLNKNGLLKHGDRLLVEGNALAAMTLMIALSDPSEKDSMVALVENFIALEARAWHAPKHIPMKEGPMAKKPANRNSDPHRLQDKDDPKTIAIKEVVHFASIYGRTCGIIRADRLYSLFRQARPECHLNEREFIDTLRSTSIPDWRCPSTIYWERNEIPYCIDGGLSDGGVYNGLWLDAKHACFSTEEEYRQGFIDLDNEWDETRNELERYRVGLLARRGGNPVKVIANPLSYESGEELVLSHPELVSLREKALSIRKFRKKELCWLTHSVKDSIEITAYRISDWGIPEEKALTRYARHLFAYMGIIDYTDAEIDRDKDIWARACLHIPLWDLNGFSISEMSDALSAA